jgi:hypothetical protein
MTTPKHSPAPWIVQKDCGNFQTLAVYSKGRKIVFWGGDYNTTAEEGVANAHLIAAAPELLAALKGTMRTMIMMHDAECRCHECRDARNAIAKAEGKS